MNALVKKEIRLLLPAWIVAMLLGIASLFLGGPLGQAINLHTFCLLFGGALLGVAPFGQEFSSGGILVLLSQPVERRRIWLVKTAVLAAAFLSIFLILPASFSGVHRPTFLQVWEYNGFMALWAFALFSGGLWTTLLLRQMTGAFWLTLVTPLVVVFTISALLDAFASSNHVVNTAALIGLALYATTGLFWSRRLFLQAQDLLWAGGEIRIPWRRVISERAGSYPRHWMGALLRKELQLQQASLVVAGIVLVLHLASVFIRKVHPHISNRNVESILDMVWGLWLLIPLLIGSAAVAEERKLGLLESQLCLPISRRVQLAVKFFVGLVLSLILGAAMPLAIESPKTLLAVMHSGLPLFVIAAAVFFISFYASTLSRSVLQTLGVAIAIPAIVGAAAIGSEQWLISAEAFPGEYAGRTYLAVHCIGWPVLVLVLWWLTVRNFKRLHEHWILWRRNAMAIVAAFVFIAVLTNAIYFRAWEILTPLKLPHGPARFNASNPPKLILSSDILSVLLPDGRLCFAPLVYGPRRPLVLDLRRAQFIGSSNWTQATRLLLGILAIKSNGSLWFVQEKVNPSPARMGGIVRVGSNADWRGLAGGIFSGGGVLVLKKGGTLWNWGTNLASIISQMQALNLATPPAQIGHETNWAEVFSSGEFACAKKSDGSVWCWQPTWTNATFHLVRETNSNYVVNYNGFFLGNNSDQLSGFAEVKVNGELWFSWNKFFNNHQVGRGETQLGQSSKWKAVAFANRSLLALRRDGTLWRWTPFWELTRHPGWVKPVQVGSYSGWIALGGHELGPVQDIAVALAVDGSFWAWGNPSSHSWLVPSRKPVFLGNLFQGPIRKGGHD